MTPTAPAFSRPPGSRRGVSAFAAALLTAGIACAFVAPAHAAGSGVRASQPLVVLLHDHVVRASPSERARRVGSVDSLRPLTHVRTVLPVLGRATSKAGNRWLRVRLPGRPNGHAGWIRAWQTRGAATRWHIVINLAARRVTVYRSGRVARRFRAVVGAPSTPTPRGRFFVEEAMSYSRTQPGGPFALATSARSHVLLQFAGGPGQIGLHGTQNLWGPLGSAASHGCIRISPAAITWLAHRIGGGVPLTITR